MENKCNKFKKIKELFKGEHGNFKPFAVVATSLVLLILLVKPGNNLVNWIKARVEIARQERLIETYRRQMDLMDERIRLLTSDRDTLEKFAREQFNLAAPGEDVYILED